jgi:hypothetical protein
VLALVTFSCNFENGRQAKQALGFPQAGQRHNFQGEAGSGLPFTMFEASRTKSRCKGCWAVRRVVNRGTFSLYTRGCMSFELQVKN